MPCTAHMSPAARIVALHKNTCFCWMVFNILSVKSVVHFDKFHTGIVLILFQRLPDSVLVQYASIEHVVNYKTIDLVQGVKV